MFLYINVFDDLPMVHLPDHIHRYHLAFAIHCNLNKLKKTWDTRATDKKARFDDVINCEIECENQIVMGH